MVTGGSAQTLLMLHHHHTSNAWSNSWNFSMVEWIVTHDMRERVTAAHAELGLEDEEPLKKAPLHVHRIRDRFMVDEVVEVQNGGGEGGAAAQQDMFQTLLVRMDQQEQRSDMQHLATQTATDNLREHIATRNFRLMHRNMTRFGGIIEGAFVVQRANHGQRRQPATEQPAQIVLEAATLSHNPRTLMELWREHKFGTDGRKPAEQFTARERNNRVGGMKQKCHRRKAVWECMDGLVRAGNTPNTAAHRIRQACGCHSDDGLHDP